MAVSDDFKTSVRVHGVQQQDEFRALCALLGRRPHELAADFVLDGIRRYRDDPAMAPRVAEMVKGAREYQGRDAKTGKSMGPCGAGGEHNPDCHDPDCPFDPASNVIQMRRRR